MGDALEPDKVSKLITKILKTPHPKTRYVITPKKFMMWTLPNLISDRTLDRWVKKFFDKVSSKSNLSTSLVEGIKLKIWERILSVIA